MFFSEEQLEKFNNWREKNAFACPLCKNQHLFFDPNKIAMIETREDTGANEKIVKERLIKCTCEDCGLSLFFDYGIATK